MIEEDASDPVIRNEIELFVSSAQALAVIMQNDSESRERLKEYADFLLSPLGTGKYHGLVKFLEWYGVRYILPYVQDILGERAALRQFTTAVEFGPGTGWLIGDLALHFWDCYAIDKRPGLFNHSLPVKFMQVDLEKEPLTLALPKRKTLIVANQFLHCVNNAADLVKHFSSHWWLVIEPLEGRNPFPYWFEQMSLFGATPLPTYKISNAFDDSGFSLEESHEVRGQWISLWKPREQ